MSMSEDTGNSQPPFDGGSTQPLKPVKKAPRWRSILISVLGVIAMLALGIWGGYFGGVGERQSYEASLRTKQMTEQFQFALVDEQFGRYDTAQQRLQYIIQHDPTFPGAQAELTKILVLSTIPTATPSPTITPTPDLRGEEAMFSTAQQLTSSGDWPNAIAQLDQLRKEDPKYKTSLVDGMYYFALRNYGMDLLLKQGNLEGGIYELTLAEKFAPLDNTASSIRDGARLYLYGASFYGVDWKQAVNYFAQAAAGYPALSDGTMNSTQRYAQSLMRYGDQLWAGKDACGAYEQYQKAAGLGNLDAVAAKNSNQAYQTCYPATATPEATATGETTTEPPTGEAPTTSSP